MEEEKYERFNYVEMDGIYNEETVCEVTDRSLILHGDVKQEQTYASAEYQQDPFYTNNDDDVENVNEEVLSEQETINELAEKKLEVKRELHSYITQSLSEYQLDSAYTSNDDVKNVKEEALSMLGINKKPTELKLENPKFSIDLVEHKLHCTDDISSKSVHTDNIKHGRNNVKRQETSVSGIKGMNQLLTIKKRKYKKYMTEKKKSKHCNAKFECFYCSKIYSHKQSLQGHIIGIHMKTKYECTLCRKIYTAVSSLRKHIKSVHNGIKYKFNECQRMVYDVNSAKTYLNVKRKRGIKHLECDECLRSYTKIENLKRHINTVHMGMKQHFECNICLKKLTRSACVTRHINVVHSGMKHKCNICRKMFGEARELERHVNTIHMGINFYECDVCKRRFTMKQGVEKHMYRVHEAMKQRDCDECHRKFTHPGHLKIHKKAVH